MDFIKFHKIPRLNRECIITEKIDGTNAQVYITPVRDHTNMRNDFEQRGWTVIETGVRAIPLLGVVPGSRNRWLTPKKDNYGFAKWVGEHAEELVNLGVGRHFGEWWGNGIQKSYPKAKDKFLTLFNTWQWRREDEASTPPECCSVVPILYQGPFHSKAVKDTIQGLRDGGSVVSPGDEAEGIVVFHVAANSYFKVTLDNDEMPKGAT